MARLVAERFSVTAGSAVYDVVVHADGTVVVDGESFAVTRLADARWLVSATDGARTAVAVVGDGRAPWVGAAGTSSQLTLAPHTPHTSRTAAPPADMRAPMPATVVSIAAPPGTVVAAGDPVLVVEAMKMTVSVKAPRAGTVRAVHCRVGELVKAGTVLAELEG